jgi:hypothetical protein
LRTNTLVALGAATFEAHIDGEDRAVLRLPTVGAARWSSSGYEIRIARRYDASPVTVHWGKICPSSWEATMAVVESTPERLILKCGSTTLTLSKETGRATLQRKMLFWSLKPAEAPLSDITDVLVDAAIDRASGVEVCSATLIMRGASAWAFPSADRKDAETSVAAVRKFLALTWAKRTGCAACEAASRLRWCRWYLFSGDLAATHGGCVLRRGARTDVAVAGAPGRHNDSDGLRGMNRWRSCGPCASCAAGEKSVSGTTKDTLA